MSHCLWEDILLVWLISGIGCMACLVVMNDALTPSEAMSCVTSLILGPLTPILFGIIWLFHKIKHDKEEKARNPKRPVKKTARRVPAPKKRFRK